MAVMTEQGDDERRETRWSANKKTDAVLRLLRGEPLDEVSRQLGVEAHRLAAWRDEFLAAGRLALRAVRRPRTACRPSSAVGCGRLNARSGS